MGFLVVALLTLTGIHTYLWFRLARSTTSRGPTGDRVRRWAATATVATATSVFAALVVSRVEAAPGVLREVVDWIGYVWLAVMFYLLVWLLPFEIPRALVSLLQGFRSRRTTRTESTKTEPDNQQPEGTPGATDEGPAPDPGFSRRVLLSRGIALTVGVGAAGTVGFGMTQALGDPVVERVPITLRKLDHRLAGFRIGLVSDIHVGPFINRTHVTHVVQELNRIGVDLVAVVGDLVDGSVGDLGDEVAPLADLKAPHGTYFVTGNHEYYSGVEEWVEFLPKLGIHVLRNERVLVGGHSGGAFELAGVNDISADVETYGHNGSDLDAALKGRDSTKPLVLLAHQPVMFPDAARGGVDLQLSGHTHGGQLAPFDWLVQLEQGAVSGRYQRGTSQLYVTRGVGFWGPPVRVLAPPEITIIELRAP